MAYAHQNSQNIAICYERNFTPSSYSFVETVILTNVNARIILLLLGVLTDFTFSICNIINYLIIRYCDNITVTSSIIY